MMDNGPGKNHVYTVELRFSGDHLCPDEISTRLKLQPFNSWGELQNQTAKRQRRPFWSYNGQGEVGFQAEWENLEDGLMFLVRRLKEKRSEVSYFARKFHGLWWCGHFQASFDGGPTLSPGLLIELSGFGLPLCINNYFSSYGDAGL